MSTLNGGVDCPFAVVPYLAALLSKTTETLLANILKSVTFASFLFSNKFYHTGLPAVSCQIYLF